MALTHHTLVAWQRADDLFIRIHVLCRTYPTIERYELSSQSRRAAYSVAANIVEGFGRRTPKDRLHFLHMAEASPAELGYCLHVARRLGYISEQTFSELEVEVKRAGAPLSGLADQLSRVRRV
ncbi:MAG TPA: four helix bundle protein [Vicinamibacterales bacterium]|nr:four helix bundle protein [Vicinamibacterales bacterium]